MTTISGSPSITVTLGQIEDIGADRLKFSSNEDKQLFLDAINKAYADGGGRGIELEVPLPTNAGQLGLIAEDRDRYDSVFGNVYEAILQLRKSAHEMEASEREAKQAGQQLEYDLGLQSAQKIREAGWVSMAAGIVSGALQIGGGIAGIYGSAKAMKVGLEPYGASGASPKSTGTAIDAPDAPVGRQRSNAITSLDDPAAPANLKPSGSTSGGRARSDALTPDDPRMPADRAKARVEAKATAKQEALDAQAAAEKRAIDRGNIEAQGIQGKWNAIGQIFQGSAGASRSIIEVGSSELDAQKAVLDAKARKAANQADADKEGEQIMRQLKDDAQNMLRELESARSDSVRGIISA